jgi:hypothetical protein
MKCRRSTCSLLTDDLVRGSGVHALKDLGLAVAPIAKEKKTEVLLAI